MLALHKLMLRVLPNGWQWFHDGKNSEGRIVANPTIGYGIQTITYANGKPPIGFR